MGRAGFEPATFALDGIPRHDRSDTAFFSAA